MADDEPRNSSCTASSATSSGGSSTSPSLPSPAAAPAPPPLPLVAVAAPPPFAPASIAASIATAIPLPQQQQLLQQYQQQFQQQQRLLSLQLSSTAASSPPATVPLKHPLPPPPPSAAHHVDYPTSAPAFTPGGAVPSDRHSRDDCWSEGATITLIHAWGDRYLELNRGNLKQKHWKDVADCVNRRAEGSKAHKTDIQCKNRLDTLKKKYKLEKSKIITGGGPSKWAFFDRLDELIGPSKKPKKPLPAVKLRPSLPLMPAPLLAPAPSTKRFLEEADQLPQLPPPSLPPISNHCASPAANHVAANHHLGSAADTTSKSKESPDMTDSCPNADATEGKGLKRKRSNDDPMKELAQAIINFGEIYERIEISKQQKMVELEKQRMIFTKDLELQRLQFFMQTQVELAKLKHSSKHGNADNCL